MVLGACVRLVLYAKNHHLCFDERIVVGEHRRGSGPTSSRGSSAGDQLAPVGFLIVERAIVGLLGATRAIGRLFPLACGLIALSLYLPLAHKVVSRRAALIALTLFAFSEDLIYFSCEVKQYSLDLAVAIAISLATLHAIAAAGIKANRLGDGAGMAIASPWFSFSAVFIVSGLRSGARSCRVSSRGACEMPHSGARSARCGPQALLQPTMCRSALLSENTSMYVFWDFAFLPVWPLPMSIYRTQKTLGILLDVFVSPLNMVQPPWGGVLLPLITFLIGVVSLARRSWRAWVVFVVPILLAMIASAMRRYPFHGRLILELVPAFFLLIALGADRLGDVTRRHRQARIQGCPDRAPGLSLLDGRESGHIPSCARLQPPRRPAQNDLHSLLGAPVAMVAPVVGPAALEFAADRQNAPDRAQNTGMSTRLPPFIADSWRRGRPWSSWPTCRRRAGEDGRL